MRFSFLIAVLFFGAFVKFFLLLLLLFIIISICIYVFLKPSLPSISRSYLHLRSYAKWVKVFSLTGTSCPFHFFSVFSGFILNSVGDLQQPCKSPFDVTKIPMILIPISLKTSFSFYRFLWLLLVFLYFHFYIFFHSIDFGTES